MIETELRKAKQHLQKVRFFGFNFKQVLFCISSSFYTAGIILHIRWPVNLYFVYDVQMGKQLILLERKGLPENLDEKW